MSISKEELQRVDKEIEQEKRFEDHKRKSVVNLVEALNSHVEGIKSKSSFRDKIVQKLENFLENDDDLDPVMLIKMYEIAEKAEEGSSKFLTDVIKSLNQKEDTTNPLLPDEKKKDDSMKKPERKLNKDQEKKLKDIYDSLNQSEDAH